MECLFPTRDAVRIMRGSTKTADIGSGSVRRLMTYKSGATETFFAADATSVHDISTAAADTPTTAAITGLAAGEYAWAQIGTSGGQFGVLSKLNTTDAPRIYDGSSWSTMSVTGATATDLGYVWLFKNRLWFVEHGTATLRALPVDSIGGAVVTLQLRAVFQRGSSALFGASWSGDSGEGLDDRLVIVGDTGEVLVYALTDPTDPATISLIGRYEITPPLGPNAHFQVGGDLVIATLDGMVPLSQVIARDSARVSLAAISRPIEPAWRAQVAASSRATAPWSVVKWDAENMALVSLPHATSPVVYGFNVETNAWFSRPGWDAQAWGVFGDALYFGDSSGNILRAEVGGSDNGALYTARLTPAFQTLGNAAQHKECSMIRATLRGRVTNINPRLSVAVDWDDDTFPSAPSAAVESAAAALWDSGVWDLSAWDDGGGAGAEVQTITTRWRSVPGQGFAFAPQIQLTLGNVREPSAELVSMDMLFKTGGLVV
ncbi:MAG: hypothetical protein AAFR28_03615 [Pseudomonadota bacterium]